MLINYMCSCDWRWFDVMEPQGPMRKHLHECPFLVAVTERYGEVADYAFKVTVVFCLCVLHERF